MLSGSAGWAYLNTPLHRPAEAYPGDWRGGLPAGSPYGVRRSEAQLRPSAALTLGLALLAIAMMARPSPAAPPASEILKRALDLNSGIEDYTVRVKGRIKVPEGVDIDPRDPMMNLDFKVLFKRPERVKIEANQPVMMPKQLFVFSSFGTMINEEGDVALAEEVVADGVPLYKIQVAGRGMADEDEKVYIWIEGRNFTVRRMEIQIREPGGEHFTLKIHWTYVQVEGFFVPSRISARLPKGIMGPNAKSDGEVNFEMTDWRINTGLSEDVFR